MSVICRPIDQNDGTFFVCSKCSLIDFPSKKCSTCRLIFFTFPSREMLYKDIPDKHVESAPKITLGEVINVNPNSYETIQAVLENLRDQVCHGVNRE